jgi:hypothetical protein
MIEVGKTYKEPLNADLTVIKIDNNTVHYLTNLDDRVRTTSIKNFTKWIKS